MQTQLEWCQYPGVKIGSFRAREKKKKKKKREGKGKEERERERETDRKFILLNILGWPKSLFKKGRKEEKKEKNSFKYIGLSIMFV